MTALRRVALFSLAVGLGAAVADADTEIVGGEFEATAPHVDLWRVAVDEATTLQIDVLAYECSSATGCVDFFDNGIGNDLIDTVIWLGTGLAADPMVYPFVTGLIDVNDDCPTPCSADGSVQILDSYLEVSLSPGEYVLAVEGLYDSTDGRYRLTFTALDTETLSVSRQAGLPEIVRGEFAAGSSHVDFWHFQVDETTLLAIDVLAYECWGTSTCEDFFANGVGNDLIDTVIWLGDGLAADPANHPFVSNLIDVNDDCSTPCSADGSGSILDSYLEVALSPGHYVLAVEGLYSWSSGRYELTFTASDTDTLAVSRPVGLNVDLGLHFDPPSGALAAAGGLAGTWNEVGLTGGTPVDVFGRPSAASIAVSAATDTGYIPGAVEDAELLLFDNVFTTAGNVWSVAFGGLAHGDYDLYLYAPGNPSVSTGDLTVNGVSVAGIPGGGYSGDFIEGTSYLVEPIHVDDGTLTISGTGGSFSGLAGLQLVPEPSRLLLLGVGVALLVLLERRWHGA